jgi:hypothetical protein
MTTYLAKGVLITAAAVAVFVCRAQVVINEGSNRNFQSVLDEDGQSNDWIELYNAGEESVNLAGYSLSDDPLNSAQWIFPSYTLEPGQFLLVFCSGKDRSFNPPFQNVHTSYGFVPQEGWNQHDFSNPFVWDGVSNLLVNSCSYSDAGYTVNSIFRQTATPYISSTVNFQDYSDASCYAYSGETHSIRPNIRLNGITIGQGEETNGDTWYPAPYGNWYWGARNQMLYTAEELLAAGLTAGPINNIAWDVVATQPIYYTYVDISLKHVAEDELSAVFITNEGAFFHTNFTINSDGEEVCLYDAAQSPISCLQISCPIFDYSAGLHPDASQNQTFFISPSPGSSNNGFENALSVALPPAFSVEPGIYNGIQSITISDINTPQAQIYYTTNGDLPTQFSTLYQGEAIPVFQSMVLRARCYVDNMIPSSVTSASYLINVSHSTPIVSVTIPPSSLYGAEGIFDNWTQDWERYAYMEFYDSTAGHPLLFSRHAGMQVDGGAGGSRANPQRSFRLELAKASLGESPVELELFAQQDGRNTFSRLYFRNGSNQWLTLPYKDGAQVEMMCEATNAQYSPQRPVTVYLNGQYFGLYELRSKLDKEYYQYEDGFSEGPFDNLTLSYWYGLVLRANDGSVDNYWQSLNEFWALNPQSEDFLDQADALFDLQYFADYVIAESWMGNGDWAYNNIRLQRNPGSGNRWRFSVIDLELSLLPGGWSDCWFNGLQHTYNHGEWHQFLGPFIRSTQNQEYRHYFINRYADVMNTAYRIDRLLDIESSHFDRWVLEMPNEYQRWGDPWNINGWMNDFYNRHIEFRNNLICKSEVVRDQVQAVFGLPGQVSVTLEANPSEGGYITINTITPEQLPWDGIYYHGVPVSITAVANEGYEFTGWSDNGVIQNLLDSLFTGELNMEEITFTANFEELEVVSVAQPESPSNELLLQPNPASDWLQVNSQSKAISGWEIFGIKGDLLASEFVVPSSRNLMVEVGDLPSGLYIIRLRYKDGASDAVRWVKD